MLLFNIRDYEDFKYVFGLETHGNGVKSRKNKILLQHLKNPALIRYCREHNDWSLLHIRNMANLKQLVLDAIQESGKQDPELQNKVILIGKTYWSGQYRTDEKQGLCEDFDKKAVRYINVKTEHPYKMKAGKFITALLKETELGKILSDSVINWLSEEFSADWQTFSVSLSPDVVLHVDDNFEKIYSDHWCKNFNGCSCMSGRGHYHFYEDSVEAKAAYITDKEGYVLARAIIYTDAIDQNGKKWRLLERQYSKESNEVLKRTLIDLLIKAGEIDAYKQVGAGCSEATAFVDLNGNSISNLKFSIKCDLDCYGTISFQDSFKFFSMDEQIAYNYPDPSAYYNLDTTDLNLDGDSDEDEDDDSAYDDFHEYSCDQTETCIFHGQEVEVDVDNLEEFRWIESEQMRFHNDDITQCDACGEWIVKENATYNSDAEAYFCDSDCEAKYIKENFYYAEYDDDYFYNKDDVTTIQTWDEETQSYKVISISCISRDYLIREGKAFGAGDTWFTTAA